MGRTGNLPCPSTVFHSVVPTKPEYTILTVFVKSYGFPPAMSRLSLLVLILLGDIFVLPMTAGCNLAE